jgi:hypothetical protein
VLHALFISFYLAFDHSSNILCGTDVEQSFFIKWQQRCNVCAPHQPQDTSLKVDKSAAGRQNRPAFTDPISLLPFAP